MSAKFWWYPGDEGHVETLEIPDEVGISDLQYAPAQVTGQAYSLSGSRLTALVSGYDEITLSLANWDSEVFRRRLEALQRHLQAGFPVSLALDHTKAWASFAAGSPGQDDTTIVTTGNQWAYNASAALANGDEILIQHPPPATFKAEPHLISSVTGIGTLNLQTDLVFNYTDSPVLVRHRDFYPILTCVNASIQPLVTSVRRRVYSFTAKFRQSWDLISNYYDASSQGSDSTLDTLTIGNGRGAENTLGQMSRYQPWKVSDGSPWGGGR